MGNTAVQLRQAVLIAAAMMVAVGLSAYFSPDIRIMVERVGPAPQPYVDQALGFRLLVPPGYQAKADDNGLMILPLATRRAPQPEPVMALRVRPAGSGGGYPTGARVFTRAGRDYVFFPWHGAAWPGFGEVVASFRFIGR